MFRATLAAALISVSSISPAETRGHVLFGVYYDNLNHFNARAGYAFHLRNLADSDAHFDGQMLSAEVEVGERGQKLTLSYGDAEYAGGMGGNLRFGISAAELDQESFMGAESVLSILGASVKLGAYRNLDTEDNEFMLGIGLGI